jgi:putative spermidine/putrescine transport system permease protein
VTTVAEPPVAPARSARAPGATPSPPAAPGSSRADLGRGRARWALFAVVGLYLLLPLVATVLYSFATVWRDQPLPDGLTFDWWRSTLSDPRLRDAAWRSFELAAVTTVVVNLVVLPPLVWSRLRKPRIRTVMQACAVLPFVLPFLVIAYGIDDLTGTWSVTEGLQGSRWVLFMAHVAIAYPFYLWPVDAALGAAGIERLHEAAETSGARPVTTLLRVVVPNVRVGLIAGSVLAFATSFFELSVARVVTGSSFETVPLWQLAQTRDTGGNFNGAAVVSVATFVLLFLLAVVVGWLAGGKGATTAATVPTAPGPTVPTGPSVPTGGLRP